MLHRAEAAEVIVLPSHGRPIRAVARWEEVLSACTHKIRIPCQGIASVVLAKRTSKNQLTIP